MCRLPRDLIAFAFLLAALVTGTITVMVAEPFHFVKDMQVPNLAAPMQYIPLNLTALHGIPDGPLVGMPEHLWPPADADLSAHERSSRPAFWCSFVALASALLVLVGTAIMVDPGSVARRIASSLGDGNLRNEVFRTSRMTFLCWCAVISYLTFVTKVVLSSSWSGTLSARYGLDFEAYVQILLWLLVWNVAQAAAVRCLRPSASFGIPSFAVAAVGAAMPFMADPFDSIKDATFAGVALRSPDKLGQAIGWTSLALLWALHLHMLRDAGLNYELQVSYLGTLNINSTPGRADEDPAGAEERTLLEEGRSPCEVAPPPAESAGAGKVASALLELQKVGFKQTTPERRRALLFEDAPQAVLAALYSIGRPVKALILTMNVTLPALRWGLAWLMHPILLMQPGVVRWLATELVAASAAQLSTKSGVYRAHLSSAAERPGGRQRVAQALGDALNMNTACEYINLSSIGLGDDGVQNLSETLKLNTSLQRLTLSDKSFGDSGLQALCDTLKLKTDLHWLALTHNSFGDSGVQALAEAVKVNTGLRMLDLAHTSFGDSGVQALAEAVKVNTTLRSLGLSGTSFGDSGVQALAEAVKVNTTLRSLNLSGNSFGVAGMQALSESLKLNTTLQELYLSGTSFGDSGVQALADLVKVNTGLQQLWLIGCGLDAAGRQALEQAAAAGGGRCTVDF